MLSLKKLCRFSNIRCLSFAVLSFAVSTSVNATPIGFFETQFDTDWTTAGISGLRGLGSGNIALSGVSGTVNKAYLYWHGPTDSSDANANAAITFAGSAIIGTNIGFSDDNFWNLANSQAYRADVTPLVAADGNYSIADTIKAGVEINGASLVVFFDDGNNMNNRDVVTFDGNDGNYANVFDGLGWSAALNGINYSGGAASIVFGVSDGQDFGGTDPEVLINGSTFLPSGDNFNGDTLPDAGGGVSNGKLWDIRTFDATPLLGIGINNLALTTGANISDALSLIHLSFDLPAGAAPDNPGVPEPITASLAMIGLGALGMATRRRVA
jgi:hypothetical protein